MKRKVTLCVLAFALVLTCAHAMAAKISNATEENGAKIEEVDDQSFKVTYTGQKDKEYVVMVVSEAGVDSSGVPTKESIGNNQDGVVVYMDQTKGDSSGKVEFTVRPNLEKATGGQKYSIYMSSNESSGGAMKKVGSFTASSDGGDSGGGGSGQQAKLGDVDGNNNIDVNDVIYILKYLANKPGYDLTGKESVADVDKSGQIDVNDAIYILKFLANKPGYTL